MIDLNYATMLMGIHRYDAKQKSFSNYYEVRQIERIPRKLVCISNNPLTFNAVTVDVGSFHNRNIVILDIVNLLSWIPFATMYAGIARVLLCVCQLYISFPKSVSEVSFFIANFLRSLMELSSHLYPFLLITDLSIILFRKMEYLKNWKFSFDTLADNRKSLVSVILKP